MSWKPCWPARAVLGDLRAPWPRPGRASPAHAAAQRVVGGVGDLASRCGELAQDRALAHDLRIAPDVGGGRHVFDQRAQIGQAADVVELVQRRSDSASGDDVGRLVVGDQADRCARRSADARRCRSRRRPARRATGPPRRCRAAARPAPIARPRSNAGGTLSASSSRIVGHAGRVGLGECSGILAVRPPPSAQGGKLMPVE